MEHPGEKFKEDHEHPGSDQEDSHESFYDFVRRKLSVICCKRSSQRIEDISPETTDSSITPLEGGDLSIDLREPERILTAVPMDKLVEIASENNEHEQNMKNIKKLQELATAANGDLDNREKYGARKKTSDESYEKWKKRYRRCLRAAEEKERARNLEIKSSQAAEDLPYNSLLYCNTPENKNDWNGSKKIRLRHVVVDPERDLIKQVYTILVTQFLARLDISDILCCKKVRSWDDLEGTEDIVVAFMSATTCGNVYHMRDYTEDGKHYIVDELTPDTIEIWKATRNIFGIENVWTVDGSVQFATDDGIMYRMDSLDRFQSFLKEIMRDYIKLK